MPEPGSPTSDGSSRSTRPTATCSTRPGPVLPRGWWRWPTTRPPGGGGSAAAGRPRRGQPAACRSCCGPTSTRPTATWPRRRWPWPRRGRHARRWSAGRRRSPASASSGPTTWSPDGREAGRRAGRGGPAPGDAPAGRRPSWSGIGINVNWPADDADLPPGAAWHGRLAPAARRRPVDREALLDAPARRPRPRTAALGTTAPAGAAWPTTCRRGCTTLGTRSGWTSPTGRSRGRPRRSPPRATWWSTAGGTDRGGRRRRPRPSRRRDVPLTWARRRPRVRTCERSGAAGVRERYRRGYAGPLCDFS